MTPLEELGFFTITLSRAYMLIDRAVTLDFAKGVFFEANRGKNQALYLYLPMLLIHVKGIIEIIFYFVFSFTVKKAFKKEQRPIANKELLYQLSFLLHSATVTMSLSWKTVHEVKTQ